MVGIVCGVLLIYARRLDVAPPALLPDEAVAVRQAESIAQTGRDLDRRGVSSEQLQDLLTPYLLAAETAYADMMNVLKGMSVAALVPVLELFAINAFEELEPLLESPEGELLFLQKKEADQTVQDQRVIVSQGKTNSHFSPHGP